MSLYVGIVTGGPDAEHSPMEHAASRIGLAIQARRGTSSIGSEASLNVVFHLPGNLSAVDFNGLRSGTFSRKKKLLMIQVAVPEEELEAEDPEHFIFWAMREAVAMAAPAFKKAKIPFSADDHLALVDAVEAEYRESKAEGRA